MSDYMDENEIAIPLAMGMFAEWNDDIDETAWYEIGTESRLEWISQAHARLATHDAEIKAEALREAADDLHDDWTTDYSDAFTTVGWLRDRAAAINATDLTAENQGQGVDGE